MAEVRRKVRKNVTLDPELYNEVIKRANILRDRGKNVGFTTICEVLIKKAIRETSEGDLLVKRYNKQIEELEIFYKKGMEKQRNDFGNLLWCIAEITLDLYEDRNLTKEQIRICERLREEEI